MSTDRHLAGDRRQVGVQTSDPRLAGDRLQEGVQALDSSDM